MNVELMRLKTQNSMKMTSLPDPITVHRLQFTGLGCAVLVVLMRMLAGSINAALPSSPSRPWEQ